MKSAQTRAVNAPPLTDEADIRALKALAAGTANEGQQVRAMMFIVHALSGADNLSYVPGSDRDSAFAEGRRYVGFHIRRLVNLKQT